jgi:hypothetical protein
MVVKFFYRDDNEEVRRGKELVDALQSEGYEVELIDVDESDSTSLLELYDVYSYPTFVVVRDDGSMVECWRGIVPLRGDIIQFLM